ncbi:MAG: ABC-2 family transporter protein, partial [Proteobacteria bacterium]|nr:ABC-2 family transporter protein [Pseudomonadota bacterium]
ISAPIFNLINFGRYPISIFNRVIQTILTCIVPFAFVAFYPATHFLNHSGYQVFCYATPIVSIVCIFVARYFWEIGVANYSSTGS